MIKLLIENLKFRWIEWTDKRPLIGEKLFAEIERL